MPADDETLDLQSAADALGVHYQTAYRWVRNGRLRAETVEGRYCIHRRDVDEFIAARRAPRAPAGPTRKRLDTAAQAMYASLVAGDEGAASNLARVLVADGSPLATVIQQVLVPPLARIGEEWHDGRITVWQEHRAAAITDRLLGDIARRPRGRRRGSVMVAAVEGDRHSVPTNMATVALRDANWNVHHLGADIPGEELTMFCRHNRVDVAVLTVTNPSTAHHAHEVAASIMTSGVPTVVGGPGRTLDELLDIVGSVTRPEPI